MFAIFALDFGVIYVMVITVSGTTASYGQAGERQNENTSSMDTPDRASIYYDRTQTCGSHVSIYSSTSVATLVALPK